MHQLTMFSRMPVLVDREALARRREKDSIKRRLARVDYSHMDITPPSPSPAGEQAVTFRAIPRR